MLDILAEIFVPSDRLLHMCTGRGLHGIGQPGIKIEHSDDDPPLVKDRNGSWQDLIPDFETVLGRYVSRRPKIILYKKGIAWLAASREWNPMRLEKIVDIHEWAHAFHHLGTTAAPSASDITTERRLRSNRFRKAPEELKEQIAQLLTVASIRCACEHVRHPKAKNHFRELESMFFALMADQSTKYRLPEIVREMDLGRMSNKAGLLLSMSDRSVFPSQPDIEGIMA